MHELLSPVDQVEVLTVMDNSTDMLLASSPLARRAPRPRDSFERSPLRAEHGVSMLVTVRTGGHADSLLFDTGVSPDGALHNLDVLEVRPNELHAIVLSHGHPDHTRVAAHPYRAWRARPSRAARGRPHHAYRGRGGHAHLRGTG